MTPDQLRGQLESQRRQARESMQVLSTSIGKLHDKIEEAKEKGATPAALEGSRLVLDDLRSKFSEHEDVVKMCSARLDELGGGEARTNGAKRR